MTNPSPSGASSTDRETPSMPDLEKDGLQGALHLDNVGKVEELSSESISTAADDPLNPRNWPVWKKNAQILMIAFHSMMATFMASGLVPAFGRLTQEYGVTGQQASYLTSVQILLFGISPFFWNPLVSRFGRYHVCLVSALGSMVCNIGGARCTSFGSQMATRALFALLISPPMAIGSGVVTDLCHPDERAQKLGWWTLMITVGPSAGPFIMGFVAEHLGTEWIFWIFTILNAAQLLAYILLGDETLYKGSTHPASSRPNNRFMLRRFDAGSFRPTDLLSPFRLIRYPRIIFPAFAYTLVFGYAIIAVNVETPSIYEEKFKSSPQQIGYQFVSIIIGTVLGEQLSGPLSDWFMKSLQQRRGHVQPADRLWLSYAGYPAVFAGLLTWGFQLQKATHWDVTPNIGSAIASFGNQVLTTTLLSFCIDCYREQATEIGVLVNFCRQVWGFLSPFYFPGMSARLGLGPSTGVMCAIIGAFGMIPTTMIHILAMFHRK